MAGAPFGLNSDPDESFEARSLRSQRVTPAAAAATSMTASNGAKEPSTGAFLLNQLGNFTRMVFPTRLKLRSRYGDSMNAKKAPFSARKWASLGSHPFMDALTCPG